MAQKVVVGTSGADVISDNSSQISELYGLGDDDTYLIDANFGPTDIVKEAFNAGKDTVIFRDYNYDDDTNNVFYMMTANVENFVADFYAGTYFTYTEDYDELPDTNNLDLYGGTAVTVIGNALANSITTGNADDTLIGGGGKDTLIGGDGNDRYIVDSSDDVIIEKVNLVTFSNVYADIDYGGWYGGIDVDYFYAASVTIDIGGDNDTVFSSAANYTLGLNVENLILAYGSENLNGTGNAGNNDLIGNDGNNTLKGMAGDDYVYGGNGNDKLSGDAGDDYLEGGRGNNTIDGGAGNDYLYAARTDSRDSVVGGAGDDYIYSVDNAVDTLVGGANNDTYVVDASDVITEAAGGGFDTVYVNNAAGFYSYTLANHVESVSIRNASNIYELTGNATDNMLLGNNYNNVIMGLGGNDFLDGYGGRDTLIGGDGNDSYIVNSSSDVVIETNAAIAGGKDTVFSSNFSYRLTDNVENLTLFNNAVVGIGNNLDNVITGNKYSNQLFGGAGNDTYFVDRASDRVFELANEGTADKVVLGDDFDTGDGAQFTLQVNIEHLDAKDTITGLALTGNNLNNSIFGGSSNDFIDGRAGNDTMVGGLGDDTYVIDSTTDVVTETAVAGSGTDTVYISQLTSHTMANNVENAILLGGAQNVTGNNSNNIIFGNGLNNSLTGGNGNDTLNGNYGRDTLNGGAGDDTLDGGAGIDSLIGGAGNDTYYVGAGDVITGETAGTDTVFTALSTYDLTDTVSGGAGITSIDHLIYTGFLSFNATGNTLNNSITGGFGNDLLNGGAGNDTLDGASGVDTMYGGTGNDTYYVDNLSDYVFEAAGEGTADTIISSITFDLTTGNVAQVENLTLAAGAGNISATGNDLANRLTGNDDSNRLDGGLGNDTMTGGKGDDIYVVNATGDSIIETDTIQNGGGYDRVNSSVTYTLSNNVEALNLSYGGSDNINGTGNALANFIQGSDGNNTLSGLDGHDGLYGLDGNDSLLGGRGDDYLNGGSGLDTLVGGEGDDYYFLDDDGPVDVVIEAAGVAGGIDTVQYESAGTYTLANNVENATFAYGSYDEDLVFTGNALANNIYVNLSDDYGATIDGAAGNDTLYATIGGYGGSDGYGGSFTSNENVGLDPNFISLTSVENLVLATDGSIFTQYGGGGIFTDYLDGYHELNLNGFDGTASAHNQITITEGEYGSGALYLTGFGENVDFTLKDYYQDFDLATDEVMRGIYLDAYGDTLNVTLDQFIGSFNTDASTINFTVVDGDYSSHIDVEEMLSSTVFNITGTGGLILSGMQSFQDVNLADYTSANGLDFIGVDGATLISTELDIENVNTRIELDSDIDYLYLSSTGNNAIDLSSSDIDTTFTITGDGYLSLITGDGSAVINASAFSGTLDAVLAYGAEIIGGEGDDYIVGSGDSDIIRGGDGFDVLTGGASNDIFQFDTAIESGIDFITDFDAGAEEIRLSLSFFSGLGVAGDLSAANFVSAANVDDVNLLTADAYILYDSATGSLYYDATGNATEGDAVQFAQLGLGGPVPLVTADNFLLIA